MLSVSLIVGYARSVDKFLRRTAAIGKTVRVNAGAFAQDAAILPYEKLDVNREHRSH